MVNLSGVNNSRSGPLLGIVHDFLNTVHAGKFKPILVQLHDGKLQTGPLMGHVSSHHEGALGGSA